MYNQQERSGSVVFAAGFAVWRVLAGLHFSVVFSSGCGAVSSAAGVGSSYYVVGCSTNFTCFFAVIIFSAAALALAGVSSATCLSKWHLPFLIPHSPSGL